jgi:hypothetical protein
MRTGPGVTEARYLLHFKLVAMATWSMAMAVARYFFLLFWLLEDERFGS